MGEIWLKYSRLTYIFPAHFSHTLKQLLKVQYFCRWCCCFTSFVFFYIALCVCVSSTFSPISFLPFSFFPSSPPRLPKSFPSLPSLSLSLHSFLHFFPLVSFFVLCLLHPVPNLPSLPPSLFFSLIFRRDALLSPSLFSSPSIFLSLLTSPSLFPFLSINTKFPFSFLLQTFSFPYSIKLHTYATFFSLQLLFLSLLFPLKL